MKINNSAMSTGNQEELQHRPFPSGDVLKSKEDCDLRKERLYHAVKLSCQDGKPVRITFEDWEGVKEISSMIRMLSETSVVLQKGATIPVHRILKIDFR